MGTNDKRFPWLAMLMFVPWIWVDVVPPLQVGGFASLERLVSWVLASFGVSWILTHFGAYRRLVWLGFGLVLGLGVLFWFRIGPWWLFSLLMVIGFGVVGRGAYVFFAEPPRDWWEM